MLKMLPVHVGSRDPYHITAHGAGFVLAWSGGVQMRLGCPNDQREVIQILSEELVFSVPEYV
jgi:hypothetical protein